LLFWQAFHSSVKRVESDLLAVLNNSTKGEQFDETIAEINYRVLMLRPDFMDTDIWTTELSHPASVNPLGPVRVSRDQNDNMMPRLRKNRYRRYENATRMPPTI
jgi:hypothetical protein